MTTKTLVIDLDGTLASQEESSNYYKATPQMSVIHKVNQMWTDGWEIVIYTARGMKTCFGDAKTAEATFRQVTEDWLKKNRVMYTKLVFGKPSGDLYVDDKGMRPDEFVAEHV